MTETAQKMIGVKMAYPKYSDLSSLYIITLHMVLSRV
jgi:hypothetical protein